MLLTYKSKTMEGLSVTLHELKMASVRLLCYFCCLPSHLYREHQRLLSLPRADAAAVAAGHLNKVTLLSSTLFIVLFAQLDDRHWDLQRRYWCWYLRLYWTLYAPMMIRSS